MACPAQLPPLSEDHQGRRMVDGAWQAAHRAIDTRVAHTAGDFRAEEHRVDAKASFASRAHLGIELRANATRPSAAYAGIRTP